MTGPCAATSPSRWTSPNGARWRTCGASSSPRVSHELRTPLTSISGSLALVKEGVTGEVSDKARELLSIAHANSLRLVRLVNDILDMERLETGRMEMLFDECEMMALVDEAVTANAGYAAECDVTMAHRHAQPGTCAGRRRADFTGSGQPAVQCRQVLPAGRHGGDFRDPRRQRNPGLGFGPRPRHPPRNTTIESSSSSSRSIRRTPGARAAPGSGSASSRPSSNGTAGGSGSNRSPTA